MNNIKPITPAEIIKRLEEREQLPVCVIERVNDYLADNFSLQTRNVPLRFNRFKLWFESSSSEDEIIGWFRKLKKQYSETWDVITKYEFYTTSPDNETLVFSPKVKTNFYVR